MNWLGGIIRLIKSCLAEVIGNPAEQPWDERSYGDLPTLPLPAVHGNAREPLGGGFIAPAELFQIENERN